MWRPAKDTPCGDPVPHGAPPFGKTGKGMHRTVRATLRSTFYRFTTSNCGPEGPKLCSDEENSVPAQQEASRSVAGRQRSVKPVARYEKLYSGAPSCVEDAQSRLTMRQST